MSLLPIGWAPSLALALGLGTVMPTPAQAPFTVSNAGWAASGVAVGGEFTMVASVAASGTTALQGGGFTLAGRVGSPSTVRSAAPAPVLAFELTDRGTLMLKSSGPGEVVVEATERLEGSPALTVWAPVTLSGTPKPPGILGEVAVGAKHRFFRLRRP